MPEKADHLAQFESTFCLEDPGDQLTFMKTEPAELPDLQIQNLALIPDLGGG